MGAYYPHYFYINTNKVNRQMLLNEKTDKEVLESILAECAKASNEIRCSKQDIAKVESRLSFLLVLANEMRGRLPK